MGVIIYCKKGSTKMLGKKVKYNMLPVEGIVVKALCYKPEGRRFDTR
jgi:hypothetical protein